MSKIETKSFIVSSNDLSKADKIVIHLYPELTRSKIRAYFQNSCVTINNNICTNPGTKLYIGDNLVVTSDPNRKYKEKKLPGKDSKFKIVYEDGHLIIVDKEAGILSVPAKSGNIISLQEQIDEYFPKTISPYVVHRLDRETSGLLVFAKSAGICRKLKEQFENKKPERIYDAFVKGEVKPKKSFFRSYLSTDEDLNQYSVEDDEVGKLAVTHYEVEKYLEDATWVKVRLETGRRNQIRVHFSENKNPVLGDKRYEVDLAKHPKWKDKNLALHASTLGIIHPISGKKLLFKSDMPERMKEFLI